MINKGFGAVTLKNLVSIVLLVTLIGSYPVFSYSAGLKEQLSQTQNQKEELIKNKDQANKEAQTLAQRIANMDEQINQIEKEIKRTEKEIIRIKSDRIVTQKEIVLQEEELINQKELLNQALLYLYEENDQPLLYQLFSFDTFSRILDRQEYLGAAETKVSDTIAQVTELKANLEVKKQSLDQDQRDLKELEIQLKSSRKSINKEQKEKEKLLAKTKGKEDRYQMLVAVKQAEEQNIIRQIQELSQTNSGKHYDGEETRKENRNSNDQKYQDNNQKKQETGFIWPIKIVGDYQTQIGQYYGMTDYAKSGAYNGAPHNGVDMSSIPNKNGFLDLRVRSVMDGKVIMTAPESISGGWGNAVVIAHPNGLFTLYGHMDRVVVKEGQKVSQGQMIGIEGNTGASTGRHLHFSIYMKITIYKTQWYYGPGYDFQWTLNPMNFLPK